jgi:DNA-binding transcriptional LysR family regulator
LTAEGELFLGDAKIILQLADESALKVRALARGEIGKLKVGYHAPLALHILPRALAEFEKTTPGVKVDLHDRGTDELCSDLRNGTLHLALMMQPSEELIAGIEFDEIGRYPFFVAMAPGHSLARSKEVSLETLAKQPLVILDRKKNSEFHRILKQVFAPLRPNIATESDSVNSLITEIVLGKRVAMVSELFKEVVGKKLLYRRIVNTDVRMCVGIARAKNGNATLAAEKLCAAIRAAAKV